MGMHTDMRPTRAGQIAASRGDVIGVSVGADMVFWYGESVGAKVAKERHGVLLHDGDTWVWKYEDDMKHKHARPQPATPVHARRVPPRGFGPQTLFRPKTRPPSPHFLPSSICSLQAWRVVSDDQAGPQARRGTLRLHVPMVESAHALLRRRLPASPADDGRREGGGQGAAA